MGPNAMCIKKVINFEPKNYKHTDNDNDLIFNGIIQIRNYNTSLDYNFNLVLF